jgi:hypothetical protein
LCSREHKGVSFCTSLNTFSYALLTDNSLFFVFFLLFLAYSICKEKDKEQKKYKNDSNNKNNAEGVKKGVGMKIMAYFVMSFAVGVGLGNFFFTETPLFLTPFSFAASQGSGTPQVMMAKGGTAVFGVTTEMVVTLLTATMLFAAAYVLWKKYRTVQYFSHHQTHWHTY